MGTFKVSAKNLRHQIPARASNKRTSDNYLPASVNKTQMNWALPENKEKLRQAREKWDTVGVTPGTLDKFQILKTV